jgi:hypothetical protein
LSLKESGVTDLSAFMDSGRPILFDFSGVEQVSLFALNI